MPSHPLYHLYRQKKLVKIRRPLFPSKIIQFVDRFAFVIGIVGPISAAPQVYKIWILQNVGGVSLISFISFTIFDCIFLIYGVAHRNILLIVMYFLWILMNGSVVVGVLLFR